MFILLLAPVVIGLYIDVQKPEDTTSFSNDGEDKNGPMIGGDIPGNDSKDSRLCPYRKTRSGLLTEVGNISRTLKIKPGEQYFAYLDHKNQSVVETEVPDEAADLPQEAKDALDIVPDWIRGDLEYTFTTLADSDAIIYADYILNAEDPKYVDEIAFSIAHSHEGLLCWMIQNSHQGLFAENAKFIYNVSERGLDYAQLVEKDNYTTLSYNSGFGGTQELERDIYYWYLVYPRTHIELPKYYYVDGSYQFWRTFFLDDARYGQSLYDAVKNATTIYDAVEELGDWLISVMEFQYGFNYIQPIEIYLHPTQCSCGQYTIITGTMAKAALIPIYSLGTRSEDHVWNEFFDTKWIHWDTSIGDIGTNELNIIDKPGLYDPDPPEDWGGPNGALGKEVSTVYLMRGDEAIFQSLQYTPYGHLNISVKNKNDEPVDGAKIFLYPAVPGTSNPNRGVCIWGYTDSFGNVSFEVGNNLDYFIRSVHPILGELPSGGQVWLAASNVQNGSSYNYSMQYQNDDILDLKASERVSSDNDTVKIISGFEVLHERQWCENEETKPYGLGTHYPYDTEGQSISFFICDSENLSKYGSGDDFEAYELRKYVREGRITFETSDQKDWFVVISNNLSYAITKTINFTVEFYFNPRPEVEIINPVNGSKFGIAEVVTIIGSVSSCRPVSTVEISINNGSWNAATDISGGNWSSWKYDWDTAEAMPGIYKLEVRALDSEGRAGLDSIFLTLEDVTPPTITLTAPGNESIILRGTILYFSIVDISPFEANYSIDGVDNTSFVYPFNISTGTWTDGEYMVQVNALDSAGNHNSSWFLFTIDSASPKIQLNFPGNNSIVPGGTTLGFSIIDPNFLRANYSICDEEDIPSTDSFNISTLGWSDGGYTVLINAVDSLGNSNSSMYFFTIDSTPPAILFTSPGNNSIIPEGTILNFSIMDANLCEVNYTTDGWTVIDLAHPFNVSTAGWIDTKYTIQISACDHAGNSNSTWFCFTIDSKKPAISLNSPENNSIVPNGTLLSFTIFDLNLLAVNYSVNDGPKLPFAEPFDISTAGWSDGDCNIQIDALDWAGNFKSEVFFITIDSSGPVISLNAPDNNSVIPKGRVLYFSIEDPSLWYAEYHINEEYNRTFYPPFNISTSGWTDGGYTVHIYALDLAGNSNTSWFHFTVDSTPPTISFDPNLNHSTIQVGTQIQIDVSSPDVNTALYSINNEEYVVLETPYIIDTTNWPDGTYDIRVKANDAVGNEAVIWFRIEVDAICPYVVSTSLKNQSVDVELDCSIVITFSEPMRKENIENYISLLPSGSFEWAWDSTGTILTISFAEYKLKGGTTYNLTIDSEITDSCGNPMGSDYILSFTTCLDTDGDGIPDFEDKDDDNDGHLDDYDAYPLDPNLWREVGEPSPSNLIWFWIMMLVIIIVSIIVVTLILRKRAYRPEESLDSDEELVTFEEIIEDKAEFAKQPLPPPPPPPPPSEKELPLPPPPPKNI